MATLLRRQPSSYRPQITFTSESSPITFLFRTQTREVDAEERLTMEELIRSRCPSLNCEYRPAWWLNNGHLQTLYCVLGDFSKTDMVRYDRISLRVPDGGTLGLDFTPRESEKPLPDDTPIVVVLHGLTGGSYEAYVRSILATACKPKAKGGLGYRGVVVNFRGCAGVPLTSARMYSGGTTEDIRTAVFYISKRYPRARLTGIGFSLGANVLTRYLAEEGQSSLLSAGCVLGCPWNLVKNSDNLEANFLTRNIYSRAMGKNVVALLERHLDNIKNAGPSLITPHLPILFSGKSLLLREVDEHAVRLIGGPSPPFPFASAHDYYRWASSHEAVGNIRVPLLVINADDDPIVREVPRNSHGPGYSAIVLTRGGGHLGWFESAAQSWFQVDRWVKRPVLEWLKATAEDLILETVPSPVESELAEGFTRLKDKKDIAFQVIDTIGMVDTGNGGDALLAGL